MKDVDRVPGSIDELDDQITTPTDAALAAVDRCSGDFAVLGAGGKMGFHVTRMLQRSLQQLGRDSGLTAISRFGSDDSLAPFERFGIAVQAADLTQSEIYPSLTKAANVIYLAGLKFGTSSEKDLLHRFNVKMPQLVADHFRESKIVALSTGCVYSFTTPQTGGSKEQDETDPPGDYAKSCLQREQAFVDGSLRHDTQAAIVRLNYSVELRYGVLVDIAQAVLAGRPIDLQTGHVNVIWQGDAVSQILQCLPLAGSPPLIINITGTETLSVVELAERFGECLGRKPRFAGQAAKSCWLSNNTLSRQLLGEPRVSVDEMIAWISSWLLRGGSTLGKPTHFQNRDGNY